MLFEPSILSPILSVPEARTFLTEPFLVPVRADTMLQVFASQGSLETTGGNSVDLSGESGMHASFSMSSLLLTQTPLRLSGRISGTIDPSAEHETSHQGAYLQGLRFFTPCNDGTCDVYEVCSLPSCYLFLSHELGAQDPPKFHLTSNRWFVFTGYVKRAHQ